MYYYYFFLAMGSIITLKFDTIGNETFNYLSKHYMRAIFYFHSFKITYCYFSTCIDFFIMCTYIVSILNN